MRNEIHHPQWITSLAVTVVAGAITVNALLPTSAHGDARLEQQLEAMSREAMQREQRLATLQRELHRIQSEAQAMRCFTAEGGTWRLAVGGSRIDLGEVAITVSTGGGAELGLDPAGARLFGTLVQLGGANGSPAAMQGSNTSLGGTVLSQGSSTTVLVK